MNQDQTNISHVQCWLFRMAQSKWNKTPEETTALFRQNDVFSFIEEFYDTLHLSSYSHALTSVEQMLAKKGVQLS